MEIFPFLFFFKIPEPDRLCAICYEDFTVGSHVVVETVCQHRFHKHCIKKWLRLKNVCPLCHRPVFTNASQPGGKLAFYAVIQQSSSTR